jgi:hypothetical protein
MDHSDRHFDLRALQDAAQAPAGTRLAELLAVPEMMNGTAGDIFHDFNAALAKMAPHSVVRTPSVGFTRME